MFTLVTPVLLYEIGVQVGIFHFHGNVFLVCSYMSRVVRKPDFCLGENKGADQLRSNCEADQRLCFRYSDSTIPPLLIPKLSRFWVSSVTVQAGLCWTWSETQIVGFLMHRLMFKHGLGDLVTAKVTYL